MLDEANCYEFIAELKEENRKLRNALSRACGDDQEMVRAYLESEGLE